MKIVHIVHPHELNKLDLEPTVMALGFFDGIHLGHQEVIKATKEKATELGCQSAVMTFNPHPKDVLLNDGSKMYYLTPLHMKVKLIGDLGIDILYVVNFDIQFAKLSPQDFIDQYVIGLHVVHVVAGFDYSYGARGKGTMQTIQIYSRGEFTYTVVEKVRSESEKISSTKLRKLILNGRFEEVPNILGRVYMTDGTVIHGDKRGRTIGFPTANIKMDERYPITKVGVYAVKIKVHDKWYDGMCSVGYNPTFTDVKKLKIEIHILDFDDNIYDEIVEIEWYYHIREEKKFSGVDELIAQLTTDKETTREFFKQVGNAKILI